MPVSVVVSAALLYGAHLSFGVVAGVASAFVVLYLAAPALARRSREAFDRDALAIRARSEGRASRLAKRLDAAWALRLFGAPADVYARRAMIAEEAGLAKLAREHYRRALLAWEGEPPLGNLLGAASTAYLAGDDVDAVVHFQKVLDRGGSLPRVHLRLAHATLRAGLPSESVAGWLDLAEREARDEAERREVALVRALHLAVRGAKADAKKALAAIELGEAPSETLLALRDEVQSALGAKERHVKRP